MRDAVHDSQTPDHPPSAVRSNTSPSTRPRWPGSVAATAVTPPLPGNFLRLRRRTCNRACRYNRSTRFAQHDCGLRGAGPTGSGCHAIYRSADRLYDEHRIALEALGPQTVLARCAIASPHHGIPRRPVREIRVVRSDHEQAGSPAALLVDGGPIHSVSNHCRPATIRRRRHEHDRGRGRYSNFLQGLGHELRRLVLDLHRPHLDQRSGARLTTGQPCRSTDADRDAGSPFFAPDQVCPVAQDDALRPTCVITVSRVSRPTSCQSDRFVPSNLRPASTPE